MEQKNIILNQLRSMGFDPTDADELGFVFRYEDINYIYIPDEGDEQFLRIVIPNIFEVTEDTRLQVLEAMQSTALMLKYSKIAIMYNSSVWVIYEHRLCPMDDMTELLEHIIRVLEATALIFCRFICDDEEPIGQNKDDTQDNEDRLLDAEVERLLCETVTDDMDDTDIGCTSA